MSKNVLEHGHFFADTNKNILEDERVAIFVNDGRQHLRMQDPAAYDLITLEPPPINHAGVASLYSTEFYRLARSRLRLGGFMTQWLPAYQVSPGVTLSIIRSFLEVFPNAALLSGYKRELILIGSNADSLHLDPDLVRKSLDQNPAVEKDLMGIGAGSLNELAATFAAGPIALDLATRNAHPITDDFPTMEYTPPAARFGTRLPKEIFESWEIRNWCEGCFEENQPTAELTDLVAMLQSYRQSEMFLDFPQNSVNAGHEQPPYVPGEPCRLRVVRESIYFKEIFGCEPSE